MAYSNKTGLPSVTELMAPYLDKRWFTAESRVRGTVVHAACAAHLKCLWVAPLIPDYQGYFDSFRAWADAAIDSVMLVEARLSDRRLGYTGQLDIVAKLRGPLGPVAVIDIKTGTTVSKTWPVQVAAYRHLAKVDRGILSNIGASVRPKVDGSGCLWDKFDSGPFPVEETPAWNAFMGLLAAHNYLKGGNDG